MLLPAHYQQVLLFPAQPAGIQSSGFCHCEAQGAVAISTQYPIPYTLSAIRNTPYPIRYPLYAIRYPLYSPPASLFFRNLSKVLVPGHNQKIQLLTESIICNQTKGAYAELIGIGPELMQNNQARFKNILQLRPQLLIKPFVRQNSKVLEVDNAVLIQISYRSRAREYVIWNLLPGNSRAFVFHDQTFITA